MRKAKNEGEGLYTPVILKSKKTGEIITEEDSGNPFKHDKLLILAANPFTLPFPRSIPGLFHDPPQTAQSEASER